MERIASLESTCSQPEFWQQPEKAQGIVQELTRLKDRRNKLEKLERRFEDLQALWELALEEDDESVSEEIEQGLQELDRELKAMELQIQMAGPYDSRHAIVSLHPGAGGTESQDWASMLFRMYSRWAERRGFEVEVLDLLPGEEAGIKSVTFLVKGVYAYGYLQAEKGVHRLVRISPFDAAGRRHTSFASVDVIPEVQFDDEIEIDPEELRIDTYRSTGAGGQHVNKTDSAVRITHLPTGIVVSCQNERSQHANRLAAMKILQAKLLELRQREHEEELAKLRGEVRDIAWGNQIRSYIFQPYSLVKDHRTGVEVGNVQGVMDGDIDIFIEAYLQEQARRRVFSEKQSVRG